MGRLGGQRGPRANGDAGRRRARPGHPAAPRHPRARHGARLQRRAKSRRRSCSAPATRAADFRRSAARPPGFSPGSLSEAQHRRGLQCPQSRPRSSRARCTSFCLHGPDRQNADCRSSVVPVDRLYREGKVCYRFGVSKPARARGAGHLRYLCAGGAMCCRVCIRGGASIRWRGGAEEGLFSDAAEAGHRLLRVQSAGPGRGAISRSRSRSFACRPRGHGWMR
jgi:hypothetical protein